MNTTSTLLTDFVQDFNLTHCDAGICFDAMIDFDISTKKYNFQTPVLLESSLSCTMDTVCLLSPITKMYRIPTCYTGFNHQFIYFKERGLFIAGYVPIFGAYSISVFPVSRACQKATLDELRARKFN